MNKIRKLLLGLLMIVAAFNCYSQQSIENDRMKEGLKAKVKSYTEISFTAIDNFGEIKKGNRLCCSEHVKYDKKGNKIEEIVYNLDGSLASKGTYKYNEKGNKIEWNKYNEEGVLSGKTTYKYDIDGNEIEQNVYMSDGSLMFKTIKKYDNRGNMVECFFYNGDGSIKSKETRKYDNDGNNIEHKMYNADGTVFYDWSAINPPSGDKIRYLFYDEDGKQIIPSLLESEYNKFDDKGNWLHKINYNNRFPESIIEREYEYYE